MLAQALKDCLEASKNAGTPLALKTFIVGRNRLENEGAFALAEFFKVTKCSLFSYLRKVSTLVFIYLGCWHFGRSTDAPEFHQAPWNLCFG